jgi:hypothetical protein
MGSGDDAPDPVGGGFEVDGDGEGTHANTDASWWRVDVDLGWRHRLLIAVLRVSATGW